MWPAQKCSCSTASSREGHSVGPSSPQGGAELGSGMMWPQEAGQLLTPCPRSAHGPSDPQLSEQRPTGPASGVTSVSSWFVLGHRIGVSRTWLATPGSECFSCVWFKRVGIPAVRRCGCRRKSLLGWMATFGWRGGGRTLASGGEA